MLCIILLPVAFHKSIVGPSAFSTTLIIHMKKPNEDLIADYGVQFFI